MSLPISTMIYVLAGLTALTPLAVDAYLPAMPTMAEYFSTSIHNIELSLSVFLAGFSLGQLVGGPFSDHMGRRRTVFIGLLIFAIACVGIMFSTTLFSLLSFRVIQAFGGGMAIVNSSAIIRDLSSGRDSARHLSNMSLIMMAAPLLAPLIGITILQFSNWHSIFLFLLIYTLIIAFIIHRNIPETRQHHPHKLSAVQRYLLVLRHRHALGYLLTLSFSLGGMFAFITGSPSVYMGYFQISETAYPFFFAANIVSMLFFNRLNVYLLHRFAPDRLLSLGQALQLIAALLLLSHILISPVPQLAIVVGLIMLFIGSQGLIVANATSSTIEFFPHNSATATALLGASGFSMGALAGTLVGILGDGTPFPMVLIMTGCILSSISLRLIFHWPQKTIN